MFYQKWQQRLVLLDPSCDTDPHVVAAMLLLLLLLIPLFLPPSFSSSSSNIQSVSEGPLYDPLLLSLLLLQLGPDPSYPVLAKRCSIGCEYYFRPKIKLSCKLSILTSSLIYHFLSFINGAKLFSNSNCAAQHTFEACSINIHQ
jgi:hypothetical protein